MSLFVDLKYLKIISNRLPLFKQKNERLYNCRCVICGDSSKKKTRARGYFYVIKNDLLYKCHNCNVSMAFGSFLKSIDKLLYDQYVLERYTEGLPANKPHQKVEDRFKMAEPIFMHKEEKLLHSLFSRLDTLPESNEAVQFCLDRKIPKSQFNRLYYIDNVKKVEQLSDKYKNKIQSSEPRLVIPFFNNSGQLIGLTCRALRNESLRYLTIKINEDLPFVFGLDKLDTSKPVYAVEGPLDSLFIQNAIAVGGTSFSKINELNIDKDQLVIVIDNQPRNKEVVKLLNNAIDDNYRVIVWPQNVLEKDINDMILSGKNINKILKDNTYNGLEAKLKFTAWKRV
ncbi:MAG: DNA primase [Alphaproteobacteria bacterium]|nr:DNA primase [Alphaproteobacteria bacterium]